MPWEPASDGRWHSTALGLSFAPLGSLLRVYDGAGHLIPVIGEQGRMLAERDRRIAENQRYIAELEAEITRLRNAEP